MVVVTKPLFTEDEPAPDLDVDFNTIHLLKENGTATTPQLGFPSTNDTGFTTGLYRDTNGLNITHNGTRTQVSTSTGTGFLGKIGVPAGAASTPSIYFGSDPNTGLYGIATNRIGFAANTTLQMEVNNSNVLSYRPLQVSYNAGTTQLQFARDDGSFTQNSMFVDSSRNLNLVNSSGNNKIILNTTDNVECLATLRVKQLQNVASGTITTPKQAALWLERAGGTNAWAFAVQGGNNNLGVCYFNGTTWIERGWFNTNTTAQVNQTIQHTVSSKDNNLKEGYLVRSTGKYNTWNPDSGKAIKNKNAITVDDALPIVELTTVEKDPSVFGVVSRSERKGIRKREYTQGIFTAVFDREEDDDRVVVNSGGEGGIWVCDLNGTFSNGDYITSSSIPGIGTRQEDDVLHSYTVAKITCDCDFNDKDFKVKTEDEYPNTKFAFVGCIYTC